MRTAEQLVKEAYKDLELPLAFVRRYGWVKMESIAYEITYREEMRESVFEICFIESGNFINALSKSFHSLSELEEYLDKVKKVFNFEPTRRFNKGEKKRV